VVRHYKDLVAWQKAMELVTEVYRLTEDFPDHEKFGLVSQVRRAAVSVPSNIAEGQGRATPGEFKQFLGHARGSLFEVETQLLIAENLAFADQDKTQCCLDLVQDVGKLINGLIRSLNSSN
jgi:four helix bundle protein